MLSYAVTFVAGGLAVIVATAIALVGVARGYLRPGGGFDCDYQSDDDVAAAHTKSSYSVAGAE